MEPGPRARLFVGGIPRSAEPADVKAAFEKFGTVVAVDLKVNFGFVEFEDAAHADEACREMDGQDICGARVLVQPAKSQRPRPGGGGGSRSDFRIFVENLPPSMSWQELKDFVRRFTEGVCYTDMVRDGVGVVEFFREGDLKRGIRDLDDRECEGRRVVCIEDRPGYGPGPGSGPPRGRPYYDDPPPRYDGPPPRYDGPPSRYDGPPPRYYGPPPRYDRDGPPMDREYRDYRDRDRDYPPRW